MGTQRARIQPESQPVIPFTLALSAKASSQHQSPNGLKVQGQAGKDRLPGAPSSADGHGAPHLLVTALQMQLFVHAIFPLFPVSMPRSLASELKI